MSPGMPPAACTTIAFVPMTSLMVAITSAWVIDDCAVATELVAARRARDADGTEPCRMLSGDRAHPRLGHRDRNARREAQRAERSARIAVVNATAGDDERTLGLLQQVLRDADAILRG